MCFCSIVKVTNSIKVPNKYFLPRLPKGHCMFHATWTKMFGLQSTMNVQVWGSLSAHQPQHLMLEFCSFFIFHSWLSLVPYSAMISSNLNMWPVPGPYLKCLTFVHNCLLNSKINIIILSNNFSTASFLSGYFLLVIIYDFHIIKCELSCACIINRNCSV